MKAVFCLLVPLLVTVALPAAARVIVDHVDTGHWLDAGIVRVFVDLTDDQDMPVVPGEVTLLADDHALAGHVEVHTVSAAKEPMALAFVLPTHASMSTQEDFGLGSLESPTEMIVEAYQAVLTWLTDRDRSLVVAYDEARAEVVAPWSGAHAVAAAALATRTTPHTNPHPPSLYRAISLAIAAFKPNEASLPRRRVLIVVSDGLDGAPARELRPMLDRLAEDAAAAGVRIIAIGFTLAMPEPLVQLEALALKSGGRYQRVTADVALGLGAMIVAEAARLLAQQIVTFTPSSWKGSARPVSLRIDVAPAGHRVVDGVSLPVRP